MLTNTRRSFFQWLTGLFAVPAIIRASVPADGLVPVKPPPHDGCIRIAWNVTLGYSCEEAEEIAEILAVENDLLHSRPWSRKLKGDLVHQVRGSDGTIQDAVRIVFHKRVPIQMWLETLNDEDKAVLRKQLKAQSEGYNSSDDLALRCCFQFIWPHDYDRASCYANRLAADVEELSGSKVFDRRNAQGEIIPGFASYFVGVRKISDIVGDMTLQDRRAMLSALSENAL